ncbi:hypothetical protein [Peterkaempfera sp. SMS 1(5)a]|uniref:hypothetical protein n=1 Tax=Peterkaempfera podocarpi TaxID=3232308 RepID=UPI00366B8739
MRRVARCAVMIAGAGGLILSGAAPAMASWSPWSLGQSWGWNNRPTMDLDSDVFCQPDQYICANGPVNSGNLKNSQNVEIKGDANDSGSHDNVTGSLNSDNSVEGTAINGRNNIQNIGTRRR